MTWNMWKVNSTRKTLVSHNIDTLMISDYFEMISLILCFLTASGSVEYSIKSLELHFSISMWLPFADMNIDEVNYIFMSIFHHFIFDQSEASIAFSPEMTLTLGSKTFKLNCTHFWAFSGILNCIKLFWSCKFWCKIWQQRLWVVWRSYGREKKMFGMTIVTTLTWRSETALEN